MLAPGPYKTKQQARLGPWVIVYQPLISLRSALAWSLLAPLTFSHCSLLFTPIQPQCSLPFLPRLFSGALISQGAALCLYWFWSPRHRGLMAISKRAPSVLFPLLLSCFIFLSHSPCQHLNVCIYFFTSLLAASLARMLTPRR